MIFSAKHLAKLALIGAGLLTGCQTTNSSEPQKALVKRMDKNMQQALTLAVSKAIGAKVTLAPDSFMTKPSVTIAPASVNRRNGQIIDGRSMEMPTHIDLMMMDKSCYVVNRSTGQKYPVKGLNCTPLI